MVDWNEVGAAIRASRKRLGWNQTELGEMTGLSQSAISAIEKGNSTTIGHLMKVLRAVRLELEVELHPAGEGSELRSPEVLAAVRALGSMAPAERSVAVEMLQGWDQLDKALRRGIIEQWKLYILSASTNAKKRSSA